jgi:enoyl-CoA hydratase/carnithine racemase
MIVNKHGRLAQSEERHVHTVEVAGSRPASPTVPTARSERFDIVEVSADGERGSITLDRPAQLNPLSVATLRAVEQAARWCDEQPDLKVVVVSGAGRAFSGGADLGGFSSGPVTRDDRDAGWRMARAIEEMRAVTVVKLHGWCVGGGFVLASACDLRLAAQSTRFSIPEVDIGIPLTWGAIPRMVRDIGPAITKELVMTCRVFDADEARSIGFLNRVVPDDQLDAAVDELTRLLASKAKLALLATKAHVNAVAESMVGSGRAWSDADVLAAGFADPEGRQKAIDYLRRRA